MENCKRLIKIAYDLYGLTNKKTKTVEEFGK